MDRKKNNEAIFNIPILIVKNVSHLPKTKSNRRKPIRIADIISYFVLEVLVFDNTDVYSSILNKMDKINQI